MSSDDFETMYKKDNWTKKALVNNYKAKLRLLNTKSDNLHIEMKFSTNLPLPINEDAKREEKEAVRSQRSMSPNKSVEGPEDGDTKKSLAAGNIDASNLNIRDRKTLTGFLYRSDLEHRFKMKEIVEDFPTMKKEVGGKNFDEAISKQLCE